VGEGYCQWLVYNSARRVPQDEKDAGRPPTANYTGDGHERATNQSLPSSSRTTKVKAAPTPINSTAAPSTLRGTRPAVR